MIRKLILSLIALALVLPMAACSVEQTEEGDAPDVTVEEGNLPEYDVDAAEVDIGTETETVTVPDVDVTMPEDDAADDDAADDDGLDDDGLDDGTSP